MTVLPMLYCPGNGMLLTHTTGWSAGTQQIKPSRYLTTLERMHLQLEATAQTRLCILQADRCVCSYSAVHESEEYSGAQITPFGLVARQFLVNVASLTLKEVGEFPSCCTCCAILLKTFVNPL
jgi:hypothetical protein